MGTLGNYSRAGGLCLQVTGCTHVVQRYIVAEAVA